MPESGGQRVSHTRARLNFGMLAAVPLFCACASASLPEARAVATPDDAKAGSAPVGESLRDAPRRNVF